MSFRKQAGSLLGRLGKRISGVHDEVVIPDFFPDHALVTYNREIAVDLLKRYEQDPRHSASALRITASALPRPMVERYAPYRKKQQAMLDHLKEEGIVGEDAEIVDESEV